MKKQLLLLSAILISGLSQSQSIAILNQNNVSAHLQDEGFFFNDMTNSSPGYEVPAGSGKHLIYSSSFWMGGEDVNGQLKLCAQQYYGMGQDYWSGFLEMGVGTEVQNPFGQTIWKVTKAEIDYHILNYQMPNYVIPNDIANWPAQGDTTIGALGMLAYIAPFVDTDGDGEYIPANGDYPCIKGDEAVYTVMHDKGNAHSSGGDPIGIELHYMFYQFSSVPGLEDVTFIDLEMVNMGTQTIYGFMGSYFLDGDVGNSGDDYVGCDTTRNLIFTYNGDAVDESANGSIGYGIPPALGVVCLSHNMDNCSAFVNGVPFPQSDPTGAIEYYNVMNGNWVDGSDHLNELGNPTDYMYYGDPNDPTAWSEVSEANIPGDRRMVMSTDLGDLTPYFGQNPNGRRTISYAVMHSQGTDNLNSVTELYQQTDFVQNFYDNMSTSCFDPLTAGENEVEKVDFKLYPNPSTGQFEIDLPNVVGALEVEVIDVFGRRVLTQAFVNASTIQVELNAVAGVYFVNLKIGDQVSTQRLIKK